MTTGRLPGMQRLMASVVFTKISGVRCDRTNSVGP